MLDGVIRYQQDWRETEALAPHLSAELRAWFRICHQTGLLGQSAERYEGAAWGNLSLRLSQGFLITCTQTSALPELGAEHFARVLDFDAAQNHLVAEGPCKASSEAMTHGIIYRKLPQVNAIFHAHSPAIWRNAAQLGLAITDPAAEYGTPEMTYAVEHLLGQAGWENSGIFTMGGHKDGVISYGVNTEQAGCLMLATLARALAY